MTDAIRNITIRGTLELDTSALASLDISAAQRSLSDFADRSKSVTDGIASVATSTATKRINGLAGVAAKAGERTVEVEKSIAQASRETATALRAETIAVNGKVHALERVNYLRTSARRVQDAEFGRNAETSVLRAGQRILRDAEAARKARLSVAAYRGEIEKLKATEDRYHAQRGGPGAIRRTQARFDKAQDEFIQRSRFSDGLGLGADLSLDTKQLSLTSQTVDRTSQSYDRLGRSVKTTGKQLRESKAGFTQVHQSLVSGAAAATLFAVAADDTQASLTRVSAATGGVLSVGSAVTGLARGLRLVKGIGGPVGAAVALLAGTVSALVKAKQDVNRANEIGLELDRKIDLQNQNRVDRIRKEMVALRELLALRQERRTEGVFNRIGVEERIIGLGENSPRERINAREGLLEGVFERIERLEERRHQNRINRENLGPQRPPLKVLLRENSKINSLLGRLNQTSERLLTAQQRDIDSEGRGIVSKLDRHIQVLDRGQDRLRDLDPLQRLGGINRKDFDDRGIPRGDQRAFNQSSRELRSVGLPGNASIEQARQLRDLVESQRNDRVLKIRDEREEAIRDEQAAKDAVAESSFRLQELTIAVKENAETNAKTAKETSDQLQSVTKRVGLIGDAVTRSRQTGGF